MIHARRAAVAVFVLLVACTSKENEASHAPTTPDPAGRWTIVAHRIPGVSAMSDSMAALWHGRVIDIDHSRAVSGDDTCTGIAFGYEVRPAGRFLGEGYHVAPFTLGLPDSTVGVTWVSCNGENWMAPGGVLIWAEPDRVFTPWDGVFFEMEREMTR